MVSEILGHGEQSDDSALWGHITREGKRYVSVAQKIEEGIEEVQRFVSDIMGHDLKTIDLMPALQFWRDYIRAKQRHAEMVKQAEKYKQ